MSIKFLVSFIIKITNLISKMSKQIYFYYFKIFAERSNNKNLFPHLSLTMFLISKLPD